LRPLSLRVPPLATSAQSISLVLLLRRLDNSNFAKKVERVLVKTGIMVKTKQFQRASTGPRRSTASTGRRTKGPCAKASTSRSREEKPSWYGALVKTYTMDDLRARSNDGLARLVG
jgi:hypothetical protein